MPKTQKSLVKPQMNYHRALSVLMGTNKNKLQTPRTGNKKMSIYNILNKLNSLMPKEAPAQKADNKPVYESVESRGSMKQGLEQTLTERYLAEKAVSKAQQQAAGAALSRQAW
ncbi:MAG: hypothetical protein LRY32_01845 [Flavobacterium sp.]|nr:hypothetical protein [Flavobacterium sp.]